MKAQILHRPFLKWAGNKYRCLQHILPHLPAANRLIEPFAGSAAVFLNTNYASNLIGDQNLDLINLYQQLQRQGKPFIDICRFWFQPKYNCAEQFYHLRKHFNACQDIIERASLFLYLNRHAFNGLCRFNKKGQFNVPFGRYLQPYFPEQELLYFWQKSSSCEIISTNFNTCFELAQPKDLIYCDPPYFPHSKTASFIAYTKDSFDDQQQQILAELALNASHNGAHVLISNHDIPKARALYHKASALFSFPVTRSIAAQGNKRKQVQELLAYFKPKYA